MAPVDIWMTGIVFFLYGVGTCHYLLSELDVTIKHRHHRDWHFYIILVTLPGILGVGPRYRPISWKIRLYYAQLLLFPLPIHCMVNTFSYNFMKVQFPLYQIHTLHELTRNDFHLGGSLDVLNAISRNVLVCIYFIILFLFIHLFIIFFFSQFHLWLQYPEKAIKSFHLCNINDGLKHLKHDANSAVGSIRQHLLNCPEYTPSKIYCFEKQENVASYQPSLLVKGNLKPKIDRIMRRLFEAGIFMKWIRDCQRRREYEIPYIASIEMQLIHLYFPLIFLTLLGNFICILTLIAELITANQMKKLNRHRIWEYLEKCFSGHRYYLNDWPRHLRED